MNHHIIAAQRVLSIEAEALETLSQSLTHEFSDIVDMLTALKGRIILTGVGKSGHVARKIASTLASTGSPAFYIHPTEASHGDIGMIRNEDAIIALSRSGETSELADIIGYCRRFSILLVGMTAHKDSALGHASNYILHLPNAPEACAETRAPTTSTTLQIALGDALAVALLEAKGFTAKDFKTYHPGGSLGAALATVSDIMHKDDSIPLIAQNATIDEALNIMSQKGFGCIGIIQKQKLVGIITDGDIRRNLPSIAHATIKDIMTSDPKTADVNDLAADILRRMTEGPQKIMQMFVIDNGHIVGIIHLHDFLRAGIM